jgi:hypothetical protein
LKLNATIEPKNVGQIFKEYQDCFDYCNSCTDRDCLNACKSDACGKTLLTQIESLNLNKLCEENPTVEFCIMKKVCAGKPEACGIANGMAPPQPTVADCRVTCQSDPFGCVGITHELFLEERGEKCQGMEFTATGPTYRAEGESGNNISVLYLPIIAVESVLDDGDSFVRGVAREVCVANISTATDGTGRPDLSRSIFQVVGAATE